MDCIFEEEMIWGKTNMINKNISIFVFTTCLCLLMCADAMAKQKVSKNQISEAIEKIKTSALPTRQRDEAASELYDLTLNIDPKNIDDETLNNMIELLDMPRVPLEVASSLANLKSRGKKAIPKILRLLNEVECDYEFVDSMAQSGIAMEDVLRNVLKRMGVKHPVVNCSSGYAASNLSNEELRNAATRLAELHGKTGRQTQTTSTYNRRNGEIYNPDGIELVYVEGANGGGAASGKGLYIGKYEITQEQWKVLMGNTPRNIEGDDLPVDYVSWDDVKEFLSRLNAVTGRNYRLPTEGEWEFAARGGTADSFCPDGCKYSGSNNFDDVAWLGDNSGRHPHPVGSKRPNELGIYDMSGNVWEWCEDRHERSMVARVVRGCDWEGFFFSSNNCSIAVGRWGGTPDRRYRALGFRVLLPSE